MRARFVVTQLGAERCEFGHFALNALWFLGQGEKERPNPTPGSDSTQMSPPCHCTMRWQMAKPMPVPGISLPCSRLKMPKMRS